MGKIDSIQPPLHFIKPDFDINVYRLAKIGYPFKLYFSSDIRKIEFLNIEILGDLYHQFIKKKIRLMIAFRHPNAYDPLCLVHTFFNLLPKYFQQSKIKIDDVTHFHFIWDRGIPMWAGDRIGKLYSKLGGTPIHRGKVDWKGLNSARNLFVNGRFPLAIAPEGATNGLNEIIAPLEPGIGQLGLWCLDDLEKQARQEGVVILPLGIKYSYLKEDWRSLEKLLDSFNQDIGGKEILAPEKNLDKMSPTQVRIYHKLYQAGINLLTLLEDYYRTHYGRYTKCDDPANISMRLNTLMDHILSVPESFFMITPKGSIIDRCRKLEQASWNWIYREDIGSDISLLQKKLYDRMAFLSKEMDWHMRLVESFVSVTGSYVQEKPSYERFTEITFLIFDTISKIKTGSGKERPDLGKYRVQL
ncbi:MAG TPA: hypothetical protein PKL30_06250, partial [Leptospiraceae bacterium]|nr:hypothetical protein [Leptospiraceae bacterium]